MWNCSWGAVEAQRRDTLTIVTTYNLLSERTEPESTQHRVCEATALKHSLWAPQRLCFCLFNLPVASWSFPQSQSCLAK